MKIHGNMTFQAEYLRVNSGEIGQKKTTIKLSSKGGENGTISSYTYSVQVLILLILNFTNPFLVCVSSKI